MADIFETIASPQPASDRLKIRARTITIVNNMVNPKQVVVQVESYPFAGSVPLDLPRSVIGQFAFDPIAEAAKDSRIAQALGLIEAVITERLVIWKANQDAQKVANLNALKIPSEVN